MAQDDPELAPMFEDIQKNGMQAMMKYWNDPKVLAKIGERMGDVSAAAAPGAAPAAAAPSAPEIDNLLDAARCDIDIIPHSCCVRLPVRLMSLVQNVRAVQECTTTVAMPASLQWYFALHELLSPMCLHVISSELQGHDLMSV